MGCAVALQLTRLWMAMAMAMREQQFSGMEFCQVGNLSGLAIPARVGHSAPPYGET
jgi:hypothetical protein